MKGKPLRWREEELAWIEARRDWPRDLLHAVFVYVFDRFEVTPQAIKALCKRNRWLTGRTGQFAPGQEPANKGRRMPYHPNSAATRFRKGQRCGMANRKYKPIGTERITRDGYVERKIHDGMPLQSRWRAVHLINWEARHGPLPEGHALKCLDGDKSNTDPSNWEAVPRALLPRLAGRWARSYDDAPSELKPTILTIAKLAHAVRQKRKGS